MAMEKKKLSENLRDIKERAMMHNEKKPVDKLFMRHTTQRPRGAARFDNMCQF